MGAGLVQETVPGDSAPAAVFHDTSNQRFKFRLLAFRFFKTKSTLIYITLALPQAYTISFFTESIIPPLHCHPRSPGLLWIQQCRSPARSFHKKPWHSKGFWLCCVVTLFGGMGSFLPCESHPWKILDLFLHKRVGPKFGGKVEQGDPDFICSFEPVILIFLIIGSIQINKHFYYATEVRMGNFC